jgi:hypothetical protein
MNEDCRQALHAALSEFGGLRCVLGFDAAITDHHIAAYRAEFAMLLNVMRDPETHIRPAHAEAHAFNSVFGHLITEVERLRELYVALTPVPKPPSTIR